MTTTLARSIVLQSLFEWDMAIERGTAIEVCPEVILARNIEEFATERCRQATMYRTLRRVLTYQQDADAVITKVETQWPLETIARVDRVNLRMAVVELLLGDVHTPPTMDIIDNAVYLARTFGGESSARFVNKVLVNVYLHQVLGRVRSFCS